MFMKMWWSISFLASSMTVTSNNDESHLDLFAVCNHIMATESPLYFWQHKCARLLACRHDASKLQARILITPRFTIKTNFTMRLSPGRICVIPCLYAHQLISCLLLTRKRTQNNKLREEVTQVISNWQSSFTGGPHIVSVCEAALSIVDLVNVAKMKLLNWLAIVLGAVCNSALSLWLTSI